MKKGFTLIELLVVIAIIGILATVVIVNVAGARVKSEKAKIADGLATAIKAYAACESFDGTKGTIPTTNDSTGGGDVCAAGTIADTTEMGSATATWPAIPATSKFRYIAAASLGTNLVGVELKTDTAQNVTCIGTGCSKSDTW